MKLAGPDQSKVRVGVGAVITASVAVALHPKTGPGAAIPTTGITELEPTLTIVEVLQPELASAIVIV